MTSALAPNHYEKVSWSTDLYRIGVTGDGSCFFHALLTTTDETYLTRSPSERTVMTHELRIQMAAQLTIDDFLSESANGTPLYKDLPQEVSKYQRTIYQLGREQIEQIERELTSLCYHPVFKTFTSEQLSTFLRNYLAFREYISTPGQFVGDELHLLASRTMGVDIYITKDEGELGYAYNDPEIAYKDRRSIILLHVNGNHWEPVGRLVGKALETSFEPTDSIICRLRKYNQDCWARLTAPVTPSEPVLTRSRSHSRVRSGILTPASEWRRL